MDGYRAPGEHTARAETRDVRRATARSPSGGEQLTPRAGLPTLLACLAVLARPCTAAAQSVGASPDPLALVRSMGKPPAWKPFTGGYYGLDSTAAEKKHGGGAFFGVYKDLMPSIVGMGVSGEGYVGGYSGVSGVNGGVRALAELRGLHLKTGVDYDFQRDDTSFILSLTVPLRRGGIFGHGTHVRVDWLPGRGNSWNFGVQVPLEPHMGKTRPRHTDVALPRGRKGPLRPWLHRSWRRWRR